MVQSIPLLDNIILLIAKRKDWVALVQMYV